MELVKIKENDKISIEVKDGNMVISPIRKHKSLDDGIKEYEDKYECKKWNTGKSQGKEIF
ncbi:MAG: AbrB family transcriptional regulator [Firmicutes bacterium]|nr:AbrB family transcriptional regulator [Bacillota bacterium]